VPGLDQCDLVPSVTGRDASLGAPVIDLTRSNCRVAPANFADSER